MIFQADVADGAQIRWAINQAETQMGPVQALINNTGIAQQKLFSHLSGGIAVYDPASEGQYCKSVLHLGYFRSEL